MRFAQTHCNNWNFDREWVHLILCLWMFLFLSNSIVFLSLIHSSSDLSEPVDVYSDWIDACEAANQ